MPRITLVAWAPAPLMATPTPRLPAAESAAAAETALMRAFSLDVTEMPPEVVVTPPLKRWETMYALSLVYRDAYFSQLVDRYQAKWKEYADLASDARENFIASGFGLVSDPVARATPPVLATTPGPQQGGTFYACVAWLNAANQEGAPSMPASVHSRSRSGGLSLRR